MRKKQCWLFDLKLSMYYLHYLYEYKEIEFKNMLYIKEYTRILIECLIY